MSAQLHVLHDSNSRDIPATLRRIAQQIEDGVFRPPGCVLVLDGTPIEVFYAGSGECGPQAVLLLATAQAKIINGTLKIQEEEA